MKTRERIAREIFLQRVARGMKTEKCGFREIGKNLNYCGYRQGCEFKDIGKPYAPQDAFNSYTRIPTCNFPRRKNFNNF